MSAGESLEEWAEQDRRAADRHLLNGDVHAAARALRRAEMKERGHDGEVWVGAELADLEAYGYRVLHDLVEPGRQRANIDHLLVGPCGIVVVDAKNWADSPQIVGGQLRAGGWRREDEVGALRQQRAAVLLQVARMTDAPVLAALCFANPSTQLAPLEHSGVTLLSLRYLEGWVRSRPAVLSAEQVETLATHLLSTCVPAHHGPGSRPRGTAGRVVRDRPRRGGSRRRPSFGGRVAELAAGLMLMAAVVPIIQHVNGSAAESSAAAAPPVAPAPVTVACPSVFWVSAQLGRPVVAQPAPAGTCRYGDGAHPSSAALVFAEANPTMTAAQWSTDVDRATGARGCGVFSAAPPSAGSSLAVGACVAVGPSASATDQARAAQFEEALVTEIRQAASAP